MYRGHFGLSAQPFGISPQLHFLYKSGAFEESMAHLLYGLENSEAIVLITGAIGTGKTMAVQSFLAQLGDRYLTALITNTRVDAKELLKLVLEDIGVAVAPGSDKSDLLIAFKQLLIKSRADGHRVIVVIDEAQNLGREVLEEVRLLTNLGQGDEQPVQIVLVGQPELEAAIEQPDLAQLRQRIRVHCRLLPLTRAELAEYVDHRIQAAGGRPGLFTAAALDRVFALSGGVPRVVNTLCADALLAAYVANMQKVEVDDVGADTESRAAEGAPTSAGGGEVGNRQRAADERAAAKKREEAVSRAKGADTVARAVKDDLPYGQRRRRSGGRGRAWALAGVLLVGAAAMTVTKSDLLRSRASVPVSAEDGQASAAVASGHSLPVPARIDTFAVHAEPAWAHAEVDSYTSRAPDGAANVKASTLAVQERVPEGRDSAAWRPAGLATPEPAPTSVTASSGPARGADPETAGGSWLIHVSSFRTAEHALAVAKEFSSAGIAATVRTQLVGDVTWHRVCLGPYASHDAAVDAADSLRLRGAITYTKILRVPASSGT